jgi:UDP-N-acetyl-D-glucosamine dehydrogenase
VRRCHRAGLRRAAADVEFALKDFRPSVLKLTRKKQTIINAGKSHIVDVSSENVRKCLDGGKFHATTNFAELDRCDVIIICVPTPLRKTKDPDMSYILAAGEQIKNMRGAVSCILESTLIRERPTKFCSR